MGFARHGGRVGDGLRSDRSRGSHRHQCRTNEGLTIERDETPECQFAAVPNDVTDVNGATGLDTLDNIEKFSFFMRFLAPPSTTVPGGANSITEGFNAFVNIGCSQCHTPSLPTGNAAVAALRNKPANLYSDLALHNMGPGLADGIAQGVAQGDEFRTAPLWGLGQRIFFLHDGRTKDLAAAIQAHSSAAGGGVQASEANSVINSYNALPATTKQNLLNFLRSL